MERTGNVTWQCSQCRTYLGAPTWEEVESLIAKHECKAVSAYVSKVVRPILKPHELRVFAGYDADIYIDCKRQSCLFIEELHTTVSIQQMLDWMMNAVHKHSKGMHEED